MIAEEGKAAPVFSLPDQNGQLVNLSEFKGKSQVLLFAYPKALTPGCTMESKDFSCMVEEFGACGTVVMGISADSVKLQKKFEQKEELAIKLLSDESREVLEKYGFYGEKKNYGKTFMGIIRSTALIGKDGKVLKLWRNVKATGHAQKVLDFVKGQSQKPTARLPKVAKRPTLSVPSRTRTSQQTNSTAEAAAKKTTTKKTTPEKSAKKSPAKMTSKKATKKAATKTPVKATRKPAAKKKTK